MWFLSEMKQFTASDARKNLKKYEDELFKQVLNTIACASSVGRFKKSIGMVEEVKVKQNLCDKLTALGFKCKIGDFCNIEVSWENTEEDK